MQEWGSRKKWGIRCMDMREKEIDRKDKQLRRLKAIMTLVAQGEVYGVWDT